MSAHRVAGAPLDFAALRAELEVPGDFSPEVERDAADAGNNVTLPDEDATGTAFVTIDPAGSRDLDQAVHISTSGAGFLIQYAIADVGAFVIPGSALDAETLKRGEPLYFPDVRVALHPPSLSEGAASLLPGVIRPAVLWRIELDGTGEVVSVDIRRARVRSSQQLDYGGVQRLLASGSLPDAITLLETVGRLLLSLARRRHAIDLDLPEQQVHNDGQSWTLTTRQPLAVESYNAQISLLTGMCAAQLMLDGGVGILRTVPPPDQGALDALRRIAHALNVAWPKGALPGDVLATLDRSKPTHVAFIEHATSLLRGAGYTPFDGSPPAQQLHAGIGAPYAHVTAPLRRLVDRYASEICLAIHTKSQVPEWVRSRLPELPDVMGRADHLAHTVDRAVVDMTEAWLLRDRVGQSFAATVIDADEHAATIVLDDPPVRARCAGSQLVAGARIQARLITADVAARDVRFALT